MDRKHLKSEGKAERLTFALAMLSTKINCRNYVIFGKLQSVVAPCTSDFIEVRKHVISRTRNLHRPTAA